MWIMRDIREDLRIVIFYEKAMLNLRRHITLLLLQ